MPREAFLYLLRQEFKWNHDRKKWKWWTLLYILIGVALGLTSFTLSIRNGHFRLEYMWYFSFAFPFVLLGMSYSSISKEWKNRMYGWWLSLPYSRSWLILTKFLAAWLQTFMVFLVAFVLLVVFCVYAVFISDSFTFEMMLKNLGNGLPWLLAVLAYYPIVAALSFLTFISGNTKYRLLTPLLWMILIVSLNAVYWVLRLAIDNDSPASFSPMFTVKSSNLVLAAFIISWLLAWGLLKLSARWLEREMIL